MRGDLCDYMRVLIPSPGLEIDHDVSIPVLHGSIQDAKAGGTLIALPIVQQWSRVRGKRRCVG